MKRIISISLIVLLLIMLSSCGMVYRVTFYDMDDETYQDVKSGDTIKEYIPVKEGYTFIGWYTVDDELFDINTPITKNLHLYAYYDINEWKVKFVVDDNDEEKNSEVLVKNGFFVEKPNDPVKDEYLFLGWLNGSSLFDFNTKITSDITLKAYFEKDSDYKIKININFNSVGGGDFSSISVRRWDKIGPLPVCEKEGYDFIGWYLNDTLIDENYIITEINDFTLIARYNNK